MDVEGNAGARRALSLLFGIPDRFNDFCHIDQITFVQLADWILANVTSKLSTDISVEESLFVFLDIVAQGNSFSHAAYNWDHDVQLTHGIFLNVLNALTVLRESREISPDCPSINSTKARWRIAKMWRPGRSKIGSRGLIKIGDDGVTDDGLEVNQENLKQALLALNNFIYEQGDYDD
ncbi:hypothetical protein P153DRAFT_285572 [Dothidotthia symphoricarpi CBS 119687]|uniref:DUF8040 domain-containing protein n=1 Tax=Dothidotthia symphoricarpi CBS 119687 TaxID=1392245 RepID=A0A6A6ALH2_9PLEO|nr:uncharacterized protein P153DRAFT_285572 [Dothidotthia symphoricarpi CBS 119687]KAF2131925.1 hypothetical protein P153DRAFT_285572 [Dothidotthia symphoricarpi CBS 119687]